MDPKSLAKSGLLNSPENLGPRLRKIASWINVWTPFALSKDLNAGERLASRLLGEQIIAFRGEDGTVSALEDRCPHRGIKLSLGCVKNKKIQCAYHGWLVDGNGAVSNVPHVGAIASPISVRTYAIKEQAGIIWIFVGDPSCAESSPLPDTSPFGNPASVDLMLSFEVRAHWSFVLDNGFDLFHYHLHRGIPYFFQIHRIEDYGSRERTFFVRYAATIAGPLNSKRKGNITVSLDGNKASLDFDGYPILNIFATPRTANGQEITVYYLVSFPTPLPNVPMSRGHRFFLKLFMPFVRKALVQGFNQDGEILACEQARFNEGGLIQNEINPVIMALHKYIENETLRAHETIAEECWKGKTMHARELMNLATLGELVVIGNKNNCRSMLTPDELADALQPGEGNVSVKLYRNICLLCQ